MRSGGGRQIVNANNARVKATRPRSIDAAALLRDDPVHHAIVPYLMTTTHCDPRPGSVGRL